MKVPRCMDCDYHSLRPLDDPYIYPKHWCLYPNKKITFNDKRILAKDTKTSPKWCPLRNQSDTKGV